MNRSFVFRAALAASLFFGLGFGPVILRGEDVSAEGSPPKLKEGSQAPAWSVQDLEGHPLRSADLKGKIVVVDFWATWCAPCVSEIPGYIELQNKYRDQGVVFVGLSLDEAGPETVRKFVKARKINYLIGLADSDVQTAFGSFEVIPTTFVIDRDGRIRHIKTGAAPKEQFEAVLASLLK